MFVFPTCPAFCFISSDSMSSSDLKGVAYLCCHDDCEGFTGILITQERDQFSLKGKSHGHCEEHKCDQENGKKEKDEEFEDQHTCCYEATDQAMDLVINPLSDFGDPIILHNVMRCGGDNFDLVSKHVSFITDELLVDEKAEDCIRQYFSPQLLGKGCYVCIGQFQLNRQQETDR